jgi:GNAT superfamily N-acetyltransferase
MLQPRYAAAVLHRCSGHPEPEKPPMDEICIRPIGPDDKGLLLRFFENLSPSSIAFRFLTPKKALSSEELSFLTEVDPTRHVAIAATLGSGDRERIVGIARYVCPTEGNEIAGQAEVAVTVADEFQGLGVGGTLIRCLIRLAKKNGVDCFLFNVSGDNRKVLAMIRRYFRPVSQKVEAGAVEIVCPLDNPPPTVTRAKPLRDTESRCVPRRRARGFLRPVRRSDQ